MDEQNGLKEKINNLIWMHAPDSLTLKHAEVIACDIYSMVLNGATSDEQQKRRTEDH